MGSRRQNRTTNHTPQNSLERMDWDWLELGEISEDPRLQMRLEGLDEKHVRDLMATVEDNGLEDPIIIVREGRTLWLADGFHRVEAYRRVGGENWRKQRIKATVLTGTFDDAKQLARKANLRHGKPLSPASRKAILFDMVRGGEEINGLPVKRLSNTTLAGELGVHQDTIGEWFKELIDLESTGGNPPVAQTDRDVVFDRNGREIRVAEIAATNRRRAEEEQERKRQERLNAEVQAEAERLAQFRASNVIFRAKFVAEMFLHSPSNRNIAARLKIDLPSENTPEENKTFGYYVRAADKRFVLSVDRESQFIRDFKSHKDISWYQTLLSVITPAIWEQAESQDWDEQMMQQWLDGFKQRHSVSLPSAAPQPGMAQPKHPDLAYQSPTPTGRHRLTEVTAIETEPALPSLADSPFYMGQELWVVATGEMDTVTEIRWSGGEWCIWTKNSETLYRVGELSDVRPIDTIEAEINTNPDPCPFQKGNLVIYQQGTSCRVLDTKWTGQYWELHVADMHNETFIDDASQFELTARGIHNQPIMPFYINEIVRDVQTGQLAEVIGFNLDGSIRVQGEDENGQPYLYEGWAENFTKYDMQADPPAKAALLSNGKRQAEIMIEDARSLLPRLLLDTTEGSAVYRQSILVQWEAPKSIQTLIEHGDYAELKRLERDLLRARGELVAVIEGADKAFENVATMIKDVALALSHLKS